MPILTQEVGNEFRRLLLIHKFAFVVRMFAYRAPRLTATRHYEDAPPCARAPLDLGIRLRSNQNASQQLFCKMRREEVIF
jgi:hypothetical protein